jgi:predicted dinucleotide-binding enzyme
VILALPVHLALYLVDKFKLEFELLRVLIDCNELTREDASGIMQSQLSCAEQIQLQLPAVHVIKV